jgi:GxxExxY protein
MSLPVVYVMAMADRPVDTTSPDDAFPLQALTGTIIAAAFSVFRSFGYGFLEPVYRRSLGVDLTRRGLRVGHEVKYELFHFGEPVGCYKADMVVDSRVIVETKTSLILDPLAPVQLLNYLCAAQIPLGLVVHFGPKGVKVKRVIWTRQAKSVARRN